MADFVENATFGLKNSNGVHGSKTPLYVKLTDASLKAFEDLASRKTPSGKQPTVKFENDTGVIRVPCDEGDAASGASVRQFTFQLSAISGDPNGSFEVVQQLSRDKTLLGFGAMHQKLTVRATEEVFEKTRENVKQAEEDSRKNIAKELKPATSGHRNKNYRHQHHHVKHRSGHHGQSQHGHGHHGHGHSSGSTSRDSERSTETRLNNSGSSISKSSAARKSLPGRNSPNIDVFHMPYRRLEGQSPSHSSPGTSPAYTGSQGSPSSSQKRPSANNGVDDVYAPAGKKQRVSRVPQTEEKPAQKAPEPAAKKSQAPCAEDKKPVPEAEPAAQPRVGDAQRPASRPVQTVAPLRRQREPDQDDKECDIKKPATTNNNYLSEYVPIKSAEQRRKYKADFQAEYEEYRALHAAIEARTRSFGALETELRKHPEGSEQFEDIKRSILEQYNSVKKDATYTEQRRQCDHLHKKLGHIKQLIADFDHHHQSGH